MGIDELRRRMREERKTPEYELERVLIDFTEAIYELMKELDVSKSSLADRLDKTKPWVSKLLSGDHNMTFRTAADVLWYLDSRMRVLIEPIEVPQVEEHWSGSQVHVGEQIISWACADGASINSAGYTDEAAPASQVSEEEGARYVLPSAA